VIKGTESYIRDFVLYPTLTEKDQKILHIVVACSKYLSEQSENYSNEFGEKTLLHV
jgi:hypothetical protein